MSIQITDKFIDGCRAAGACLEGLAWVSREPRPTLAELAEHRNIWAEWAAFNVACLTDAEWDELHELTGYRAWYRDGQRHREDGPAIEWADGSREWFRNGQRHRDDGPAVEWADGTREWFRDGVFMRVERAS